MNKPPYNDDDIDAWLDRREPLFRRSHASDQLEPPNEIDNVVLAKARAALRESQRDAERRSPLPAFFTLDQWALPLGLAATLVIALAVVIRVSPDEAAIVSGAQDIQAPAAEPAAATAPAAPSEATPLEQPPATRPTPRGTLTAPAVATPPVERRQEAAEMSRQRAAGAAADASKSEAAIEATVEAKLESAADAAPTADTMASNSVPPPPPAAAPPAVDRRMQSAPGAAAYSAELATEREQDVRDDPRLWYQRIVELRAAGNTAAAEREWRELKARHPDFIPPAADPIKPR